MLPMVLLGLFFAVAFAFLMATFYEVTFGGDFRSGFLTVLAVEGAIVYLLYELHKWTSRG